MGYTFKSLCIRNFKYITNNKPLKFDFMNSNIVILDGQNGYGKTTLFDAIEVLVTGKIKHFNPSLQNRKTETLGTLANDVNKDIVISAILSSDFSDEIHVERKLLCKNEFQSIITLNSQEISQEELYDKFHLSSNMFDIGTYISQSESLDFLQNKYKNRKDSVSSLLDDTDITDKIQMLKSVQEHILGRVEKEIRDKEKQIDVVSQRVNEIKRQTDHIVMNAELPGENIRLFDEVEYEFDVIKLDQGVTYETVIRQLKQIEGFIENYEEYLRYKDNAIIRELKASPKRLYMALFYRQEIELLNKKGSLIKELNKSKELLTNYSNNVWSVDETLFNKIKIKAEIITQIKTLLLNQKKEQSQLDDADKVLAQMTKARRGLIKEFYNAAESGKFDKNKCPLCGTDFTDIDSAIIKTEKFIKNIHTDGIKIMVYSGRIIQNYPLGLGIRAVIKTNQLVFEAASKSGSDVYNILSTGQLNGLSIALLLSIKNVYGDTKGLDILLIDDPLQTIDDISAISLADLLTQQGIGQIVLSTHEEAKAALLRYKFKHAGMSVREQNMQALYMKTVTEE